MRPCRRFAFARAQEDEDIGLDNSKHGGSAYTHDLPSEMAVLNTGGEASKDAGRA